MTGCLSVQYKKRNFTMLKRIILFAFIFSALALIALTPMNTTSASENTARLQATVITPPEQVSTPVSGSGMGMPNATGMPNYGMPNSNGMPNSTIIIIGLLIVLGIAVIVGGMALANRRA